MCERAAAQTRSCKQMHEYRRTRRHDLTVYCSRFYGRPISLLLPFVLRIISLHGMGGFELSHFLFIPCMSPIFTFPFHLDGISFVSFFFFFLPSPSFGGQFAVTAVQTGGPKPLRYFCSLFTFLSLFTPSLRSLSLSLRITRLFGTQNRAGSLSSICTVHLDGIVC